MKRLLLIAASLAALADAQTIPMAQNALINKDVVTLAKAGFNEDFIIDTIAMSRTHFDTTPDALAALAKEGLTERVIRFMMQPAPTQPTAAVAPGAAPAMAEMPRGKSRTYIVKPSAVNQAINTQAVYSNTTSVFWGLWKKKVGVGSAPKSEPVVTVPLGGFYNQVRLPQAGATPAAQPAFPYYQMATRYVVLQ